MCLGDGPLTCLSRWFGRAEPFASRFSASFSLLLSPLPAQSYSATAGDPSPHAAPWMLLNTKALLLPSPRGNCHGAREAPCYQHSSALIDLPCQGMLWSRCGTAALLQGCIQAVGEDTAAMLKVAKLLAPQTPALVSSAQRETCLVLCCSK